MKKSFLSHIIELLDKSFPNNWYNEFTANRNEKNNSLAERFKQKLHDATLEIFDNLNLSVLSGEYVLNTFSEEISKIQSKIREIEYSIEPFNDYNYFDGIEIDTEIDTETEIEEKEDDLLPIIQSEFSDNFILCIKSVLSAYQAHYIRVKNRYIVDNKKTIYHYNTHINSIIKSNNFHEVITENIDFFLKNIEVSRLDHFLLPNQASFNRLISINEELDSSANKLCTILKSKCTFLIYKWILRQQYIEDAPLFRVIDDIEEEIVPKNHFYSDVYSYWGRYIETHYQFDKNADFEITSDYNELKYKQLTTLSFKELHRLVKYYKDVNPNISNLRNVRKEFEKRYSEVSKEHLIDKYSKSLDLIYALNNEFSLLVSIPTTTDEEIEALYTEIENIENATCIFNFFHQLKYLDFLTKKLKSTYEQKKALAHTHEFRRIIDKCEKIFEKYSSSTSWSQKMLNYVYQLPYHECLIPLADYTNNNLPNLFIASSFLLPLADVKYKKELETYKSIVHSFKTSIETFENIETDMRELENTRLKLTALEGEIKNNQLKAVEIISIFSAIVTFVVGSLPTFKYIKNVCDAAMFMVALSTSLILFITLLLQTLRDEKRKLSRRFVVSIFILVLLAWACLIIIKKLDLCSNPKDCKTCNETVSDDEQVNNYTDKINLNNTINISNKQPINKTTKPPSTNSDTCRPKGCPPCPDCSKISNTSK